MSKHSGLKMSGIVLATVFLASLLSATILLMTPGASKVEASEKTVACRMVQVALDDGYSISRIETRQVCGFDR